ncbi:AraC family transcriptional regulator [Paenibacillus apiarius]|uniref:AraC family transcriptional regulator n=1 Tax=Paenibacillus apiarius TaxID=46240 RepID=UPI003B3A3FFD
MNVKDHILLWNHAVINVMDVRHMAMECREQVHAYRLPASAFLFAARGSAQIWLNGNVNMVRRFHVLHGGKGACLDIEARDGFECYLILYKAALPPSRHELQLMLEHENPFQQQYAFTPQYPVILLDKARQMHDAWRRSEALEKLQAKSLFYQFVYELLWQIQRQGMETSTLDLSGQVVRYLTEHYRETITLEAMARQLNYSPQYLSKKFKDQTGCSPIHFLIQLRMERAQELLLTTDATLQEVAASVGYPDLFYFNRMFKKHAGMAPGQYKNHKYANDKVQHPAKKSLKFPIVNRVAQRYISNDDENHYQYNGEGDFTVYKRSKASMATAVLLCLTLLLSACGTGGANTNAANGRNNTTKAQQTEAGQQGGENQAESTRHGATKTVSTPFGDVDIPVKPQRIVAIDYLGSVIALGATPVGSSEWLMENPYIKDKIAGVENVGESIEKVMELEPDLIITLTTKQEQYEKYNKIAPTVSVPYDTFNNVHEEVAYFGELLGLQEEASAWLAEYDARIAAAKAKVDQAIPQESTFSVLEDQEKTVYILGGISGRGGRAIYEALGRKPPAGVTDEIMQKKYHPLSMEVLADYAGDYIVLTTGTKTLEEYKADPIWGKLDAVRQGRVYVWDEARSWFSDPIALLSQTEELADWLTAQSKS